MSLFDAVSFWLKVYACGTAVWLPVSFLLPSIHQRPRKPRKARPLRLLTTVDVSQLLFDRPSTDGQPLCMYSCFVSGEQCGWKPAKDDAKFASRLRETIAVCRPDEPAVREMLDDYAKRGICNKHLKQMSASNEFDGFWGRQIDRWLQELCFMYDGGVGKAVRRHCSDDLALAEDLKSKLMIGDGTRYRQPAPQLPGYWPASQTDSLEGNDPENKDENVKSLTAHIYRNHFGPPSSDASSSAQQDDSAPRPDFTEYVSNATLFQAVIQDLRVGDSKEGYVYVYSYGDAEASACVKIGSGKDTHERLKEWEINCGYRCDLKFSVKTANARRVERLVHTELQRLGKRRHDHRCANKVDGRCDQIHKEWFEVTPDEAEEVIMHWVRWMEKNQPYDDEGNLRPEVMILMYSSNACNTDLGRGGSLTIEDVRSSFLYDSRGTTWYTTGQVGSATDSSSRSRSRQGGRGLSLSGQAGHELSLRAQGDANESGIRRGSKGRSSVSFEQRVTPNSTPNGRARCEQVERDGGESDSGVDVASSSPVEGQRQKRSPGSSTKGNRPQEVHGSPKLRCKPSLSRPKGNRVASVSIASTASARLLQQSTRPRVSSAPDVLPTRRVQTGTSDDPIEIE